MLSPRFGFVCRWHIEDTADDIPCYGSASGGIRATGRLNGTSCAVSPAARWDEVFGDRYIVCARGAAEDQIFCVDYNDEVFHLLRQRCTHAYFYDSREAWLKKVEENRVQAAETEKNMLQKMGYDKKRGYIN